METCDSSTLWFLQWFPVKVPAVYPWCTGGACRKRRVLLDLGGRTFDSSTLWFLQWYPLEFTEVHVFEAQRGIFVIPPHGADENPVSMSSTRVV